MRNNMEIFENNLERYGFGDEFITKAIEYFKELEEERDVQEMYSIEEALDYYNQCGSYTFNRYQSEDNLKELREDIALLKDEYPDLLDLDLYFTDVEAFEISILYLLYYNFYPQEDQEENL